MDPKVYPPGDDPEDFEDDEDDPEGFEEKEIEYELPDDFDD